jgi:hypothetical protein
VSADDLATDLAKAQQRAQIAAWDRGEAELRSQLALDVSKRELSADEHDGWNRFSAWCGGKSARKLPAKPATVAAYVLDSAAMGVPAEAILAVLRAIDVAHDHYALSSPVHTALTQAALEQIAPSPEPPRSWGRDQRAAWAALPIQVRGIITARERERDTALKRKFQELHELKLRLLSGADKPVQTNEKDYQHVSTSQV